MSVSAPADAADVMSKHYWGTRIWRILHILSCHPSVGASRPPVLARDERSAWLQLLKALAQIMPCERCKMHYKEWFSVTEILKQTMIIGDLREYLRGGLFDLHCSANVDQGRTPAPIPYADLDAAYPPQSITPIVQELEKTWIRGVELRTIPVDGVRLWRRSLATLRDMYSVG